MVAFVFILGVSEAVFGPRASLFCVSWGVVGASGCSSGLAGTLWDHLDPGPLSCVLLWCSGALGGCFCLLFGCLLSGL